MRNRFLNKLTVFRAALLMALAFGTLIILPQTVWAQGCEAGVSGCDADIDCVRQACPDCYICDLTVGSPTINTCIPNDSFCQDLLSNVECQSAVCVTVPPFPLNNPTGCEYEVGATLGDTSLGELCYYCDPARLTEVDTCGNGVCDSGTEDCGTCPEDCMVPGWDQPTCPVDPNVINPDVCGLPISFDGPPFNSIGGANCEDGDVCTNDFCTSTAPNSCASEPKSCSINESDLCCPAGCSGPGAGQSCGPNDNTCDVDCWPAQSCGDGLVESPETCDASIPGPNAGFRPDLSLLPDADCRAGGTENECTFCGDNIIDTPTEECDGSAVNTCDELGCDTTTCLCVGENIVQGSGQVFNCAFQGGHDGNIQPGLVLLAGLGLSLLALVGLRRRTQS